MTPEQQREWESDVTANAHETARAATETGETGARVHGDADLLRRRTAALDRVAADNERLRAEVERLTDELDRERLSLDYKPDGVDIVMGKLQDARRERDAYREQWHQEVENFERETARAEAAEAKLRDVEALADEWERDHLAVKSPIRWRGPAAQTLRAVLARSQAPQAPAEQEGLNAVPDWSPTILTLRQLAKTIGETPRDHLPKGAVVDTLTQVADRLLAGEPTPSVRHATADDEEVRRG